MLIRIESNLSKAVGRITAVEGKLDAVLTAVANSESQKLADLVKAKLSGPVLKARSGTLRDSIKATVIKEPGKTYWRIGSYGVPYAAINEYGGKTAAHDIFPVKAKALAFMGSGGDYVAVKSVHHPGSTIPERSYLRSSAVERQPFVRAALVQALLQAGNES